MRIGRLEAQMDDLSMPLDKDDGNAEHVPTEVTKETVFSRDEQSQRIASSDFQGERMLVRQKEEEIVQLRSQITSLISRLDSAESAVKDKHARSKRRGKNSSKSGWVFWRRNRRR